MSTSYDFYLAKKVNDTYPIIGPFIYDPVEDKYELKELFSTTGGFIDRNEFHNLFFPLKMDNIADKDKRVLTDDFSWGMVPDIRSIAYVCPLANIADASMKGGMRVGYIPLDEIDYAKRHDWYVESEYDIEMISVDRYAEMVEEDKRAYGKATVIATTSIDYIANQIFIAAKELRDLFEDCEYFVIARVG